MQQTKYFSREEMQALAERALRFSTADDARVNIQSGVHGNTRFAQNQISTAGDNYNALVSIRSAFGRRSGVVTTNRLDDDGLRRAVQAAEALARLAPEDAEAMPELGPQQYVESRAWVDTTATLDPTGRAAAVRAVKNLRFNESPIFMLNNLEAVGRPVRVSASEDGSPGFAVLVPPVKVRDFTFTSLSDAV